MNEQIEIMTKSIKELVAIGASVGAHCQPCLEHHIQAAVELGVSKKAIRAAVEVDHTVEKGALSAMKKYSAKVVEDIVSAAGKADHQPAATTVTTEATKTILAIHSMPEELKDLPSTTVPFRAAGVMGIAALQSVYANQSIQSDQQLAVCSPPDGWSYCEVSRSRDELCYINEILDRHAQRAVISPGVPQELNGSENLKNLIADRIGGAI